MKAELLAPAGDFERLEIALHYGADAVYFGGKDFGLRANALNFSLEDIEKATKLAHSLNKKVYVTVNIVFHDKDFNGLEDYLKELDRVSVDAIMISDLSIVDIVKRLNLKLKLFLSTQSSMLNLAAARFYKEIGISRVVLAREANKEDIKRIKEETGLEVECFIHGAMCTSFSGRCVMSNYATNRDSNRGGCAQICRWKFDVLEEKEPFSMTPKDLHMVPFIKEMIDMGVDSFKVEGRMRSIYYIATVIHCYRKIIDKSINKTLTPAYTEYYLEILNRCANRDATPQFFDKLPGVNEQYFLGREEMSNQDFLGIVLEYDEKAKIATIEQRNYFEVGDKVEFFGPETEEFTMNVEKIMAENGDNIEVARHPQMIIKIPVSQPVNPKDMLRKKLG